MEAQVPRSRFGLDLLIAEAKQRVRRRRVLFGIAAVAAGAAVMLTLQPWSGGHSLGSASGRPGFSRIPGMTRVLSSSVGGPCAGLLGNATSLAHYCFTLQVRRGHEEKWVLTSAYKGRFQSNVQESFARAHPGPVLVEEQWWTLASARQAKQFLRESNFTNTGRPVQPINGGLARSNDWWYFGGTQNPHGGGRQIEFFWASGSTVVAVNVIGAGLTLEEAQQIALLARPR